MYFKLFINDAWGKYMQKSFSLLNFLFALLPYLFNSSLMCYWQNSIVFIGEESRNQAHFIPEK